MIDADTGVAIRKARAAQDLFEAYRTEAAKSHAGEEFKAFVRALLQRAEESGAFES